MRGCVGRSTSTGDKVNLQYISKYKPHLTSQFCGLSWT